MRSSLFLAGWLGFVGFAGAADNPVASLTLSSLDPSHPEVVTLRLKNRGTHDLQWMDPWMPTDGILRTKYFEITDANGKEAEYTGRYVNYEKDTNRSDYRLLKSGEVVDAVVDLAKFYSLSPDTDYEVKAYRVLWYYDSPDDGKPKWCDTTSNHLRFHTPASLWEKFLGWWKLTF